MLSKKWETSKRKYQVVHEFDVAIPVSAGFTLDCDVFRPDSKEKFPVILSVFPFYKEKQNQPVKPVAVSPEWVMAEGGDYNFYVRRGYVHVFANLRGTGKSGGEFDHLGDGTIQDMYDAIEWLAKQPWCDGQVATFGTSYFSMPAKRVAELKPPSLKTIFAPFGVTDQYRHAIYHGGIFSYVFHPHWLKSLSNLRVRKQYRKQVGQPEFDRQIERALADPEINIHPELVEVLKNPDQGGNMLIVDYLLNFLDTDYYKEKGMRWNVDVTIPGYFGGCWAMHSLHLPGDVLSFEHWKGPKKLSIGPPLYLDRPVYQYHYESLRWFGITIKCADKDDKPADFLDLHGIGHLWRETPAEITIKHNNQYPSHLLVPITKGNRIGTFLSGGILGPLPKH